MKKHSFFLLLLVLFSIALSAQAEHAKTTLVVSSINQEAIQLLQTTHDNVEVQKGDHPSISDSTELMTLLLNKDSSMDIYSISVNCGIQALKEKGYLPAISSSVVAEEISHMLPAIQDVVTQQGQVVAVPHYFFTSEWGVNGPLWQEICPDRRLETWQDYFALVRWWEQQDELAEEYTLSINGLGQQQLIEEMLYAYIQTYERPDEPLRFDTPAFMDTLAAATQLTPIEYTEEDDEAWNDMINRPTLLQTRISNLGSSNEHDFHRIPMPAFEEGGSRCVYGDLTLYIINPYSQHQQEAAWYLEAVLQTMPEDDAILLAPDRFTFLEDPYWQRNCDKKKKELEEIEAALPEADDATREKLLLRQDTLKEWFSQSDEEQGRYRVTAQELDEYRDLMQYLFIGDESLFLGFSDASARDELLHQIDRYLQGNLTLEGCAQEMNRIAAQLYYENQ